MLMSQKQPSMKYENRTTPWGTSDITYTYTPGIIKYVTPSHGGIYVSYELNLYIPKSLRSASGWYEKDFQAAIPMYYLASFIGQEYYDADEYARYREIIQRWYPDELLEAMTEEEQQRRETAKENK
jgi:hypothetical protein